MSHTNPKNTLPSSSKTKAKDKIPKPHSLKLPPKKTYSDEDDEEYPDDVSTTATIDASDQEEINTSTPQIQDGKSSKFDLSALASIRPDAQHSSQKPFNSISQQGFKFSGIWHPGSCGDAHYTEPNKAPIKNLEPPSDKIFVTPTIPPINIQKELPSPLPDPVLPTNTTPEIILKISPEMAILLDQAYKAQSDVLAEYFSHETPKHCLEIKYEVLQSRKALTKSDRVAIQQTMENAKSLLERLVKYLETLDITKITDILNPTDITKIIDKTVTIEGHTLKFSEMTLDQRFHILHINHQKSYIANRLDSQKKRIEECQNLLDQFRDTPDAPECNADIKAAFLEWSTSFRKGGTLTQEWISMCKSGKTTFNDLEKMVEESISYQKERLKSVLFDEYFNIFLFLFRPH